LGQAQQYGGIKPFIAIPITSLDNMIHSDKNMYINKAKFPKSRFHSKDHTITKLKGEH
jgi:hypothetical protein